MNQPTPEKQRTVLRLTKEKVDQRTRELIAYCRTWGEIEKLAGVVDREAFWLGKKNEDEALVALVALVSPRVMTGEL